MSPNDLDVLIHYYSYPVPHERRHDPAFMDAIDRFRRDGIFEAIPDKSGYRVTKKGEKWLEMLLDTPYPVEGWRDPRD